MKLLFSGYVFPGGLNADGTRSLSVWKGKTRTSELSVLVIQHRNQIEKQKILDFITNFEEHHPYLDDPE